MRTPFLTVSLDSLCRAVWRRGGGGEGGTGSCGGGFTGSGDYRLPHRAARIPPVGVAQAAAESTEIVLQHRLRLLPRGVLHIGFLTRHNPEPPLESLQPALAALELCDVGSVVHRAHCVLGGMYEPPDRRAGD
eukprot:4623284-Prymnesium_polylepis.1